MKGWKRNRPLRQNGSLVDLWPGFAQIKELQTWSRFKEVQKPVDRWSNLLIVKGDVGEVWEFVVGPTIVEPQREAPQPG
jgi:hypothetical protein